VSKVKAILHGVAPTAKRSSAQRNPKYPPCVPMVRAAKSSPARGAGKLPDEAHHQQGDPQGCGIAETKSDDSRPPYRPPCLADPGADSTWLGCGSRR
jgi:hypothetical protein